MESAHDYLLTMPAEELDKLAKNIDRLHARLGLARLLVGGFWACLLAFGGVAVWVNTTTVALATTQRELNALRFDQGEVMKDYQIWQAKKDEIDTQIIQMLQNQAEMIKRQQMILDRVTLR